METKSEDDHATLTSLKTLVKDFCAARDWDRAHTPKDLAIALVTEASELLEVFRFKPEATLTAYMAEPATRARVADELADSLYCILRFAQMNDFDLAYALREKLIKNGQRYPATHQ